MIGVICIHGQIKVIDRLLLYSRSCNADCVSGGRELTNYKHYGFEIAHWNPSGPTASSALNAWKKSPAHKNMIINKENWSDNEWKAIGIAIYEEYAVVWFGMVEPDR